MDFSSLLINKVLAAGLEVAYPTIASQTITESTKLPDFVLYLFNAGVFLGFFAVFISLVIAGVMYLLSPISAELRANAKDRIYGAISGLLILALTYLIVTTINPQLSVLKLTELPESPELPAEKKAAGVYLHSQSGCSNNRIQPNTSSISDLGSSLRNQVSSVDIVKDTDTQTSYISILYDNVGLWGACQYINPNSGCTTLTRLFAASASIYKYDFNPNGDGVYFYRKSYSSETGGYYKVSNSQIRGIYIQKLDDLRFNGVPQEEQDCVEYDESGSCTGRSPPSLGGENISSVKIKGSYLVLFVYFGPGDSPTGIWTSCQEFPTINDVNKLGPQQMKWENIRNNSGVIPNYVIIIPIQR